ncbi:MAG TPA: PDZ domain-containing protein, partial [bacterium]|nr:PDZ domain-containing protein [bacterium]
SLRDDVASPLAPRNDEVEMGEDDEEENGNEEEETAAEEQPVEIDLEGFEQRVTVLPPEPGNYGYVSAVSGKVIYHRRPRTGSGDEESPIVLFDLEEREEQTIVEDADNYMLSATGEKLLIVNNGSLYITDIASDQSLENPLPTGDLEMTVDPRAEWHQIFNDAWRLQRDYFYDPNMHGVDWQAMRERYGQLIDDCFTRWDVNYVIGELIAELNASHTYRGGGDTEEAEDRDVGYLGVDWELNDGAYRIASIIQGAPWDAEVRSPLDKPNVEVEEGDYVLAVNGRPLDVSQDPWAPFEGLAGKTVELTVSDNPSMDGARKVLVETMNSETRLRHLTWIESNRRRVDEATDGRVGYIYVRSTGVDAQNELVRQFAAQFPKQGLIVDERFNSGGQIPDRFIELLDRPPLAFWAVRDGKDWQWPPVANFGPKVMLINGWSGSGGDAFPDYFRKRGLGPLIGTRTWGGLIGITGAPEFIDGGGMTVPTFRMYDPDGTWFDEGHGVEPDIPVPEDPGQLSRGTDMQLERAIEEVMNRIQQNPPAKPERPSYEDRSR